MCEGVGQGRLEHHILKSSLTGGPAASSRACQSSRLFPLGCAHQRCHLHCHLLPCPVDGWCLLLQHIFRLPAASVVCLPLLACWASFPYSKLVDAAWISDLWAFASLICACMCTCAFRLVVAGAARKVAGFIRTQHHLTPLLCKHITDTNSSPSSGSCIPPWCIVLTHMP